MGIAQAAGALSGLLALLLGQLSLAALLVAQDFAFLPFALREPPGGMGRHFVRSGRMGFAFGNLRRTHLGQSPRGHGEQQAHRQKMKRLLHPRPPDFPTFAL